MNTIKQFLFALIILFGSIILLHVKADAQSLIDRMGFRSGLNVSHMGNIDLVKPRVRFNLGTYYRLPLNKRFYFVPELLFQARGSKVEPIGRRPTPNVNILSMDTPALVRYTFSRDNGWMVTSGPNVSYAFRSRVNTKVDGEKRSAGFSEVINTVTFGWIGEVGYKWPSSIFKGSFLVTMRYKKGITSQVVNDPDNAVNNLFSVNAGFEF